MSARDDADRLAILVHEVRSPVAVLQAVRSALSDGERDPEARPELVRLALVACAGIERIVVDAATASVRREEVDVAALLRDVAAAAALRGQRVATAPPSDLPSIHADPQRLRQALDNLVANAVAHTPAGGQVVLDALRESSELVLSVTDSGPGIPVAEQERIFRPGVRLDPSSRPGSGLGLAIARSVAEAHGGRLTVESAPGSGARFVLALPLEDDQPATRATSS